MQNLHCHQIGFRQLLIACGDNNLSMLLLFIITLLFMIDLIVSFVLLFIMFLRNIIWILSLLVYFILLIRVTNLDWTLATIVTIILRLFSCVRMRRRINWLWLCYHLRKGYLKVFIFRRGSLIWRFYSSHWGDTFKFLLIFCGILVIACINSFALYLKILFWI